MATRTTKRTKASARRVKKKPGKSKPARASKPAQPHTEATDRRTDERRERVLQLYGKKDSIIAKILLEEGFDIDAGEAPISADLKGSWDLRRKESMRRNVTNDRLWWREEFRRRAKLPKASEDAAVDRQEHMAALRTDLDDIDEVIVHKDTKSTAKAILFGQKLKARELLAKAAGVDEMSPADADDATPPPTVVGLLIGTKNVSAEVRQQLKEQGVELSE